MSATPQATWLRRVAVAAIGLGAALAAPVFGCQQIVDIPDRGTREHVTSCTNGVCVCATGFGDCDGDLENGCEANFDTNALHCGRCGHDCLGGVCTTDGCAASFIAWDDELKFHQGPVAGDGLVYVLDASTNTVFAHAPTEASAAFANGEAPTLVPHGTFEGLPIKFKRNELGVFFATIPPEEEPTVIGPFHTTIHAIDAAGVHVVAAIDTGLIQIYDFAITEGAVWIAGTNYDETSPNYPLPELHRIDLATGVNTLATIDINGPVDADEGHVHWTSGANLLELVDGGTPTTLIEATPGAFNFFVYGEGSYYGLDSELVTRFDRATLAEQESLAATSFWAEDVDGVDFLFTNRVQGTVNRWPKGAAEAEVLDDGNLFEEGDHDTYLVTNDERGWYWVDVHGFFALARP